MSEPLRCEFFHAFDGKCCDTEDDCLCAIDAAKLSVLKDDDGQHRWRNWSLALAIGAALWVGIFALGCITLSR